MKSVLVIDDNPDIRENTAEILDLSGYKTFTAENGKKGVEIALREKPDVIICDIMMPELDGYGVLHLLRKNESTEQTPFIFLTAKTERSDFRKGMEMGADDYITKPFEDIELLNAVEIRLKRAAVLDHKYSSSPSGISQFLKDVKDAGLVKQLADQYEVLTLNKKQPLYQEGKRPRFLYYLSRGKVKCFKVHEDGKEYITDLFSEGDFLGYTALIEDKNYDDSAVVLEEADIMQIPREDFMQMVFSDISVAAKFIRLVTHNVKEKEERLMSLAYSSLRKRVAKALVDIHGKFSIGGESKPIEISREDIAHYVGTATESLIRTLSDFKSEKLIEIKEGKINIGNIEKLKNLLY
ncbi:MAG TPA: response regulator [Chitinophagaceae bacterium]|jgi:DNA-binding response OmpR family regulator|nr:response regulator [Chitinophagaceae bacterium]HMW66928.1 response regulator [Chitinophagaceae bacterium]HMX77313.1 response regulator [Chitinophagaceae bacterium]HNA18341.1 response regulator [Chitinophagaceae bacterium]HNA91551.1 response regulator [Chitinophagaceae bacterium]